MSYPVQKNPFPAVTVCPPGRDRWAFIEKVLNYVKLQCYEGYLYTEKDCIESQKARIDFRFLLEEIHNKALDASLRKLSSTNEIDLEDQVLKYIGRSDSSKDWDPYDRLVEHSEKLFRQILHLARSDISACSSITSIQEKLLDFIINSMGRLLFFDASIIS